jgi:hypothetical protein
LIRILRINIKGHYQGSEKNSEYEKTFAKHKYGKGLTYRIYKELLRLTKEKPARFKNVQMTTLQIRYTGGQ